MEEEEESHPQVVFQAANKRFVSVKQGTQADPDSGVGVRSRGTQLGVQSRGPESGSGAGVRPRGAGGEPTAVTGSLIGILFMEDGVEALEGKGKELL